MYFGSVINLHLDKIEFPQRIFIEENFPSPYLGTRRTKDFWL
jgi:hypothetical protein